MFCKYSKFMNSLLSPKNNNVEASKEQYTKKNSNGGLYVREDDQDWGSSGMNDIQKDSD